MSCPQWARLQAELLDLETDGPRDSSLSTHLDECSECREGAFDLDPLTIFRRLPSSDDATSWAGNSEPPAIGAADIAAMKEAVSMMRRTDHLQRRSQVRGLRHFAAAALLAVIAGAVSVDRLNDDAVAATVTGFPNSVGTLAGLTAGATNPLAILGLDGAEAALLVQPIDDRSVREYLASLPAVEDLDRPTASVYQVEAESSTFLMIVDDDLDV